MVFKLYSVRKKIMANTYKKIYIQIVFAVKGGTLCSLRIANKNGNVPNPVGVLLL
jgi:hypothetical protein